MIRDALLTARENQDDDFAFVFACLILQYMDEPRDYTNLTVMQDVLRATFGKHHPLCAAFDDLITDLNEDYPQ